MMVSMLKRQIPRFGALPGIEQKHVVEALLQTLQQEATHHAQAPLRVLDHLKAKLELELVEVQPENPILVLVGKEKSRGHVIKTDY